jgi:hypothetical protein
MAAEKALYTEFERQGISTPDKKASFVQYLLGDVTNFASKRRPFLWKSAYDYGDGDSEAPNQVSYTLGFTAR